MPVLFKLPILKEHVLIFRRKGRYGAPDPPSLVVGPFDCFVFTLFNKYELELSLRRWL